MNKVFTYGSVILFVQTMTCPDPFLCYGQYAEVSYTLLAQNLCLKLTKVSLLPQHIHVEGTGTFSSTASQLMTST